MTSEVMVDGVQQITEQPAAKHAKLTMEQEGFQKKMCYDVTGIQT